MLGYIGRCLVQLVVTVIGIVTVAFFLMRAIPGDPAQYMLGDYATKEALATLRAQLGLDRSLVEQYCLFVGRAMRMLHDATDDLRFRVRNAVPDALARIKSATRQ